MRELGGDITLEQCLAEAKAAGFEGIELGHKFPREAAALRAVLGGHGLDLVSGWYSSALLERGVDAELAALRPHLHLLKELGSDVLILAETTGAVHSNRGIPLSKRPALDDQSMRRLCESLTSLGDAVAGEGMRLAYHHHMGTIVQSGADIDALMAHTGPTVHLLLDTGHAAFAGADPVALARRYAPRIVHVHCKDIRSHVRERAVAEDWSFLDSVVAGVFTVPGDGGIDFRSVLGALGDYSGWLIVEAEQDPEMAPPAEYAAIGCRNLNQLAAAAGLV
jgi:inosose dehydratase